MTPPFTEKELWLQLAEYWKNAKTNNAERLHQGVCSAVDSIEWGYSHVERMFKRLDAGLSRGLCGADNQQTYCWPLTDTKSREAFCRAMAEDCDVNP